METTRIRRKQRRPRLRIKRLVLALLLCIIVPASTYFGFVAFQTYKAAEKSYSGLDRGSHSAFRTKEVKISKDPVSILLMGLENYSSGYKGGRTDSLIVATFNPSLKTIKLLSIPRDTYTYIEAKGKKDKINSAYGAGGRDETIKTVENLLDIPIDYYAEVQFDGFKDIVDDLDGVKVNVPFDFWEYTDTHPRKKVYFHEGPQHLDGLEALAYARMRKRDPRGDFGRNDRQKELIKAIIDKASTPSNVLKIDKIASHVSDNIKTNMRLEEPLYFYKKYKGFSSKDIETIKLKGNDEYINNVYYFAPDEESLKEVRNELQNHLEYKKQE